MHELTTTDGPRALMLPDEELIPTLRASLYPGATDASICLVTAYCRIRQIDPMLKPVHIVPMNVKKVGQGNQYEWRDVVMPGIGLYRIQAARTGQLGGIGAPVFGPDVTIKLGDTTVTFPEWCEVTVERIMPSGHIAKFVAREYWLENYATKGQSETPNAMWSRRIRGQIAKCAEAQALRRGFPEVGSESTAEEMEGRGQFMADGVEIDHGAAPAPVSRVARKAKQEATDATVKPATVAEDAVEVRTQPAEVKQATQSDLGMPDVPKKERDLSPASIPEFVGSGEQQYLEKKAKSLGLDIAKVLADAGGLVLVRLSREDFESVKAQLRQLEG